MCVASSMKTDRIRLLLNGEEEESSSSLEQKAYFKKMCTLCEYALGVNTMVIVTSFVHRSC